MTAPSQGTVDIVCQVTGDDRHRELLQSYRDDGEPPKPRRQWRFVARLEDRRRQDRWRRAQRRVNGPWDWDVDRGAKLTHRCPICGDRKSMREDTLGRIVDALRGIAENPRHVEVNIRELPF